VSGVRVAVIAGGPSSEAAVSRASARAVVAALESAGYTVTRHELDASLARRLTDHPPDVVFPVTHGAVGEDGCLQGLLEVLGIPYVGSGVRGSALAADKPTAKLHFRAAGLPVAADAVVEGRQDLLDKVVAVRRAVGPALVVKPAGGGSAIGVARLSAAASDAAVVAAIEAALALDPVVLVEQLRAGRELTCGVLELDEHGPVALPPTEILSRAAEWYDFRSKYAPGGSEHRCPAALDPGQTARAQEIAVGAFRALGARDLGRADLILDEHGQWVLLELNTLPGMTATSLLPEAAAAAGIAFPSLCDRLVRRALGRPRRAPPPALPMPT